MEQMKNLVDNNNYMKETERLLRGLGVNSYYKGFWQTAYAVQLAIENPESMTYICKGLYIDVAVHFHTSVCCIERNIRTVKQVIWSYGDRELIQEVFGDKAKGNIPNNSRFIDFLARYIEKKNS